MDIFKNVTFETYQKSKNHKMHALNPKDNKPFCISARQLDISSKPYKTNIVEPDSHLITCEGCKIEIEAQRIENSYEEEPAEKGQMGIMINIEADLVPWFIENAIDTSFNHWYLGLPRIGEKGAQFINDLLRAKKEESEK